MKSTLLLATAAVLLGSMISGCAMVQSLRREIDDDPVDYRAPASALRDYDDPRDRYTPPPPANVRDTRAEVVAGTAVDFSGIRAKNLRVKASDFDAAFGKSENSLWSEEGQTNYLFAANKLKMPGDLVTVVIEDRLRGEMVDSVKRLLPPEYRDMEIRVPGLTKEKAENDQQRQPAAQAEATAPAEDNYEHTDIMTAEVLERYPNGNIRLRGIKRIPFKRQVRNIEVVAIVKGSEISEKDVVKSSRFFEQRVELYR